MLKSVLIALAAVGVLGGCAAGPQTRVDSASAAMAHPLTPCLTTGTRIARKPADCAPVTGHVFTKDELDRTGATSTAEALRMLDPTFVR
jgi:hypothetical protein